MSIQVRAKHGRARGGAGEFDGNEVGRVRLTLYMYGADAEAVFAAVTPALRARGLTDLAEMTLRFSPPGSAERMTCR